MEQKVSQLSLVKIATLMFFSSVGALNTLVRFTAVLFFLNVRCFLQISDVPSLFNVEQVV